MKNNISLFSFVVIAGTISGCIANQKVTKLQIEPLPSKVRHSDETAGRHYQLGQYLQNTERKNQAMDEYNSALKLEPENIKVQVAQAVLMAESGDYLSSIAQLKKLAGKFNTDASILNNLGYAYYLGGDYINARAALEKAILADPFNMYALNNMASTLNKLGETDKALNYLALARVIKLTKAQTRDQQVEASNNLKQLALTDQTTAAQETNEAAKLSQLNGFNQSSTEKDAQENIKQTGSGVYEIVQHETATQNLPAVPVTVPEVTMLAQSGGVSLKLHPLVTKLFNQDIEKTENNALKNKSFSIEIVNGNGIKDFAKKTVETLTALGLSQPQKIADKKRYNQYTTILQYRNGFYDEALTVGKTFNKMPVLIKYNHLPSEADLRLILGRDVVNLQYKQQISAT